MTNVLYRVAASNGAATHPDYMGVWFPTCQQDCIPLRNGRCGFCDTQVDDLEADRQETRVETCKIDGCERERVNSRGPYTGLCEIHKRDKIHATTAASRAAKQARRETKASPPAASNVNGHNRRLSLTELAEAVDDAHRVYSEALERLRLAVEAAGG